MNHFMETHRINTAAVAKENPSLCASAAWEAKVSWGSQRGKYILYHEGFFSLLKQVSAYVLKQFLNYGTYYIYETDLAILCNQGEMDKIKPTIDCSFKLISNLIEFSRLLAEGYEFKGRAFRSKLEKGALVFCVFVGKSLASEDWAATNAESKPEIDYLPFEVNFDKNEVCCGSAYTDPAYRGKKLAACNYSLMANYLKKNNFTRIKSSINTGNKSSLITYAKFPGRKIIGKGHYIKFLALRYWKLETLEET